MVIGITQKKLEELRPVEASCAKVAELEEEVKKLGDGGSEVEEAKKTKLMEAAKAKKSALAALRQEKNEKARATDARVRELQRSLFQLRGKVGEGEGLDRQMLEIDEANGQTRRVLATVAEFQQRAQAAQQELAQQQAALEALKAKQEAAFAARPSEALAAVQTQLAAVEKELVAMMVRREA